MQKKNNLADTSIYKKEISLRQLKLHILDVPQKARFTSGIGVRTSRQVLLVEWRDDEGLIGFGECSCRPDPYYSAEFLSGGLTMIQEFVVPYLKQKQSYSGLLQTLKRIRGWNFAKAAVEAAFFQVAREQTNFKLSDVLESPATNQVPVGISLGIYKDKGEMYAAVEEAIEAGYQRLKFKIDPGVNTDLFDHVNPLLFDKKVYVSFDANGSFYSKDLEKLGYFVNTYKNVIEQALPPDRFDVYLEAKKRYPTLSLCADEEVKNIGDLIKLHQLKAIDELNLKIGRVGGIANSIEILNYCYENELPCWIGGMFETGIGRLLNLEMASFLPNAQAHDLSPSARYFKQDIILPEVTMNKGFVDVKAMEACEIMPELIKKYTTDSYSYNF